MRWLPPQRRTNSSLTPPAGSGQHSSTVASICSASRRHRRDTSAGAVKRSQRSCRTRPMTTAISIANSTRIRSSGPTSKPGNHRLNAGYRWQPGNERASTRSCTCSVVFLTTSKADSGSRGSKPSSELILQKSPGRVTSSPNGSTISVCTFTNRTSSAVGSGSSTCSSSPATPAWPTSPTNGACTSRSVI